MKTKLRIRQAAVCVALFLYALDSGAWLLEQQASTGKQTRSQNSAPSAAEQPDRLSIDERHAPPKTYPHAQYEFQFQTLGPEVPPLHWQAIGGLPPGLRLDDKGFLHGEPQRAGEYHFAVSVTDSGKPQQTVQRNFVLEVVEALTLVWKSPARVSGNRIDGSVQISNTTPEDIDLTFIVEAVAENGRATAIGYQHFLLRKATTDMELSFGETLPNGGYVVNVDAIGEVAQRNVIFRRRLQTPAPLQVTIGP